jgi:GAF domain-containing protein/CheY-like chemotaxis protein
MNNLRRSTSTQAAESPSYQQEENIFRRRIMVRSAIVLVIAIAILSIMTVQTLRDYGQRDFQNSTESSLEASIAFVEDDIVSFMEELSWLSEGTAVRNFAQHVVTTTSFNFNSPEYLDIQAGMMRLFEDTLARNADKAASIIFLANDGRAYGEVSFDEEGQLQVIGGVRGTLMLGDETFSNALTIAEPNIPYLSRVSLAEDGTGESVVTAYIPVSSRGDQNNALGAIQVVLRLNSVEQILNDALSHPLIEQEQRRLVLVDRSNQIIVDTETGQDAALTDEVFLKDGDYIQNRVGNLAISSEEVFGLEGLGTPWHLLLIDDYDLVMQSYNNYSLMAVLVYFIAAGVILSILYRLLTNITEPLVDINSIARQLATGRGLDEEAILTRGTLAQDELGDLTRSLGRISHNITQQEKILRARIQKRSRDLEVAAKIGREVASLYDIDTLLIRAINLICDEFDYYHAQVFLVDDVGMNAMLVQSRGRAGKQLLSQKFKIEVGSDSVIGSVTGNGAPVIVNDTNRGILPHRFNPLLPETRAELGMPLISGEKVIGVLDIQSKDPNAFPREDIPTFTLLADQLAVAISNARLVSESERRIQQIDKLNRQLTRTAWEDVGKRSDVERRYQYNLMEIIQDESGLDALSGALSAAIGIRNEVIGELVAAPVEGQEFTAGDRAVLQAVANRISLAVENARLFQETQLGLMETSTLYQMSRYLNEANTLPEIIQAIINSVVMDALGGQVWLFEEYYEYDAPQWIILTADLALAERDEHNRDLSGLRLHIPDHNFLAELEATQPTLINNTRKDARLDSGLKLIFRRFGAQSAVIIPISVRGVWRGFISLGFPEPREFGEREGRIYHSLIDQAGIAIDNRLLLQQTAEEVARNENLYAASRIINTSQNMQDLVYAAVATANDTALNFSLGLLSGRLDESGWPTQARMVAESKTGTVGEADYQYPFKIASHSPLRKREPEIVIDDTPNIVSTSETILWMRTRNTRFLATFLLFGANQPIALFHITSEQEKYELTVSDYEVYRALTGQMSSQIQIRSLLERAQTALDEVRRLYVASSSITSAADTAAVYQATVEHLARPFLPSSEESDEIQATVEITLIMAWPDPRHDAPYLDSVFHWSSKSGETIGHSDDERVSGEDFPYGRLTRNTTQPLYVPDVAMSGPNTTMANEPAWRARLAAAGISSLVAAPIQSRQNWFGVVVCHSDRPALFDEQYRRFLMALADQIAIAVDNRRLFEEANQAAERAQAEAQRALAVVEAAQLTSRIGGAAGDITSALDQVFARVAQEGGFDRWMLLLFDDSNENLIPTTIRAVNARTESMRLYDIDMPLPIMDAIRLNQTITINSTGDYKPEVAQNSELSTLKDFFGKHVAAPVHAGTQPFGGLFMGRELDGNDLEEGDAQLIETLATQVALALENRRLFQQTQNEQQRLRSILETLPTGVLVLDPVSLTPMQFNEQAQTYLGQEIDPNSPFSVETYNMCRTGTTLHYPINEMPIFTAIKTGNQEFKDDIAIPLETGIIDLMVSAAPVTDIRGNVTAIVAAFQDITNLRQLENTLQENLRETVALYEAQRQLTESVDLDDVLDVVITQLILLQPADTFILVADQDGAISVAREFVQPPESPQLLAEILKVREITHIGNVETAPMAETTREALLELNTLSVLTVPLHVSIYNAPFGWMVATSDVVDGFNIEQARILEQLSEAASTAIDNRLLMQRQQETVQEVQELYNAANLISHSRDIEQLNTVLQDALETLNPDYWMGYLDENAGLSPESMHLFDGAIEGLPAVDFAAMLQDYVIPARGLYIADLQKQVPPEPAETRLLEAGVRAIAAVNLRPGDMNSGLLVAAYQEPRKFTDGEDRYLNTLADGASVVFNNFILFAQIQNALEETSTLYQASRALSDASNATEVLSVVVNYFALPHIDRVFISLLDNVPDWESPGATAQVVSHWQQGDGLSLEGAILSEDLFPGWEQLSVRDILAIDNTGDDPRVSENQTAGLSAFGVQSLTIIPLRVPGHVIGAVWLSSAEVHTHDPREERTYRAFAEQASLSMEAAYLLQQTERRARQLATSAQVGQTAGQILDLNVLLPRVVDLIQESFAYDHVQVFLMDDTNQYAELHASTGEAGEKLLALKHKLSKGSDSVIGKVAETGMSQIAFDTADASVIHHPNPYLPLTRSEMALPLILKDKVVGALDVQSNQPNAFTDEDVRALTTLAAQIAVAIDNANLYEAAQEQADKMGFLFQITSAAAGAEALDEAMQTIGNQIHQMLEALSVTMYLPQLYVDDFDNSFITLKPVVLIGTDQPIGEIEEIRATNQTNLLAEVYRNQQAFVVEKVDEEERYLAVASQAQSAIVLPLTAGSEAIGMIVIEDERPSAYNYDILQLLLTLSGSLSAVVQSLSLLEQLQSTNEQLRELDRMKSDFLANMSHELRTPLNSIIGFSRVMLKGIDGELTEMQEQDLTTIYSSGQHLLMLINDVLDQAKIAANKMDLKTDYFEVKSLVEGVRSIGIGLVKEKNINMTTEVAPNLPQAFGDEFRTRQVLINLISNASKFTTEGAIIIRAYPIMNERIGQPMVRIDVCDSGIGIAEKDLHLLFEAFRQVDSSLTRTVGGTGLGLPIAKSLIEMQGGEMLVTSETNVGSTFSITIPTMPIEPSADEEDNLDEALDSPTMHTLPKTGMLPPAPPENLPETLATRPPAFSPPPKKIMTQKREILLIEDNKDMVNQFRRVLQRDGFSIITADHPSYAEAMVGNMQPTVLVMDVNFAEGEGWNILERLKNRDDTSDIPVVVVTLSDEKERAKELGAYGFIQRPFMPEQLTEVVLAAEEESNRQRILIIDDEPESVRLLTQLLNENASYRVFSAQNGLEGVSMMARRRPDLVILDLRMPEMDGFEVLKELNSNPEIANIPVMVVTGELSFNNTEQSQLDNVSVLQKTSISQEEYDQFMSDVRNKLEANGSS